MPETKKNNNILRSLNQIFAVGNLISSVPVDLRLNQFIHEAMVSLQGIEGCKVCIRDLKEPFGELISERCQECKFFNTQDHCLLEENQDEKIHSFNLSTITSNYAWVTIKVNNEFLEELIPAIQNLSNIVAISIENRKQKEALTGSYRELEKHHNLLENKIGKSTVELELSNAELSKTVNILNEAQAIANVGHWELDILNDKLFWSDEVFKIFQVEPKDFIANYKGFLMQVHESDRNFVKREFDKALRNKIQYNIEHRIKTKSDITKYVQEKGRIEYDSEGNAIRAIGMVLDITERKKADLYLKESEEKYRNLFNNSQIGMFRTRLNGSEIFEFNDKYLEILNYTREEVVGNPSINFWVDQTERERMVKMLLENGRVNNYEIKLFNKNKEILNCLTSLVLYPETGILEGSILDITERKRTEQIIKVSEEKYRKLFDNSQVGMFRGRADGSEVLDSNKRVLEMLNYSMDEFIGSRADSYWVEKTERVKMLNIIKTEGKVSNFECSLVNKQGEEIRCLMSLVLYPEDGILEGSVLDISDRKRAEDALLEKNHEYLALNEEYLAINEELQENISRIQDINSQLEEAKEKAEDSDRLKTAFLQNMSHELRTPMNAIMGFSELLRKTDSSEKQLKFTSIIEKRSNDLLKIIDDLFDISKIEANQLILFESEVDIDNFIADFISGYISTLKDQNNSNAVFTLNANGERKLKINIDSDRLKQVLINLLSNAFKFTKKGSIELGYEYDSVKNSMQFYIKDTGIGIHPSKHKLIFERFRQGDEKNIAQKFGGSGLGLSISKGIIDLMKGKIWVDSKEGKGSTFYFTIPCRKISSKAAIVDEDISRDLELKNKVILVVEDDSYNAEYLQALLIDTKCTLLLAVDGNTAIKMFKENPEINLVLLDIKLPDVSGFEVAESILKINPRTKIIAQTAYASTNDKTQCMEAGFCGYITKPIKSSELFTIIETVL